MAGIRKYECLGGPLCGRRVARHKNMQRFYCTDEEGCDHFYRLIRVLGPGNDSVAKYYHYFGTDRDRADDMHPLLLPSLDRFKPLKKKR